MKYRIITVAGIEEAKDAVPFRYKSPSWLSKIKVFTSRYMGKGGGFTVTEVSTGRDVCRQGFRTRKQAKAFAKERFILASKYGGVCEIKRVIRSQKLKPLTPPSPS